MSRLPAKSVLKLYRALGILEFATVLGWEHVTTDVQEWRWTFRLPAGQFKNYGELAAFCREWNIVTRRAEIEVWSPSQWKNRLPVDCYLLVSKPGHEQTVNANAQD